jgi:predicted dehydrogenase
MAPKIRVGLIGGNLSRGWGSAAHLPALAHLPAFEVTAVATTKLESATATARAFDIPLALGSAEELVARPEVDVVVVSVKVPRHDELIRAALGAGKHVFSEWPLGVNLEQASALADLATERGVTHLIGLQGLRAPSVGYARDLIAEGRIGRVRSASVVAAGGLGGTSIAQANVYAVDRAAGATVLTIGGGHLLSALEGVLGPLHEVSGIVTTLNRHTTVIETGESVEVTSPDQVVVAGRLGEGGVVSINVQGGAPQRLGFLLRIVGSDGALEIRPAGGGGGSIHISDWAITAVAGDGSVEELAAPAGYGGVPEAVPAGPPRNVAALYQELAAAINDRRPASPGFDTAVRYHRLIETIQRASDTGARQDIAAQD